VRQTLFELYIVKAKLWGAPTTGKLRIKAKDTEIEWEGEVECLENDLPGEGAISKRLASIRI
jgi:hypothetical protein